MKKLFFFFLLGLVVVTTGFQLIKVTNKTATDYQAKVEPQVSLLISGIIAKEFKDIPENDIKKLTAIKGTLEKFSSVKQLSPPTLRSFKKSSDLLGEGTRTSISLGVFVELDGVKGDLVLSFEESAQGMFLTSAKLNL